MSKALDDALRDRQALVSVGESEGWKVVCARHAEKLQELDVELFAPKTDPVRAEHLRQARAIIVETFSPQKLMMGLLFKIEGVARREKPAPPPLSDTHP